MIEERERDQVKESIIESSKQVFMRFGYAKVSMDDISRASGKGRSTLYHYFKNKKEVFEAFVTREFIQLITLAYKKTKPKNTLRDNLFQYNKIKLSGLRALLEKHSNILEDVRDHPEVFSRLNKLLIQEEVVVVRQIIAWGVEKGEASPMETADLDFLSTVLVTAFRSFEHEIVWNDGMKELENKLEWLVSILCKGLK